MSVITGKIRRYLAYTVISLIVLLLLVAATVSTFLATETGSRFVSNFAIEQLNGMDDMQVEVAAIRGNLLQGLQLEQLRFRSGDVSASVARLTASWNPNSLFTGRLLLSRLALDEVLVEIAESDAPAAEAGPDPLASLAFNPLPVSVVISELAVNGLDIDAAGAENRIQSIAARVRLAGNRLQVEQLRIEADPASVRGDLDLTLAAGLPLRADLQWDYTGSLPLGSQFASPSASGQLVLAGSMQSLVINHSLHTPWMLESRGTVTSLLGPSPQVELAHASEMLSVPVAEQQIQLLDLGVAMRGGLQNLIIDLDTSLRSETLPALQITASATLSGSTLEVSNITLTSDSGSVSASSDLDWTSGLSVTGDIQLAESDPMQYWQGDFPAVVREINGSAAYRLELANSQRIVSLNLQSLTARVDDYELRALGQLQLRNNSLQIEQLQVMTDSNRLNIRGSYEEVMDLQWQVEAPELQQFLPGIAGSVTGSGFATGNPAQPDIGGSLEIRGLRGDEFQVESLDLRLAGSDGNYDISLDLGAADITTESLATRITSASAEFNGGANSHNLAVLVNAEQGQLEVRLEGGLQAPDNSNWQGRLGRARFTGEAGNWQLTNPIDLEWANNQLRIQRGCWQQSPARLCFDVTPQGNGDYAVTGFLADFPLDEFNAERAGGHLINLPMVPRLPSETTLGGTVNIDLSAYFGPDIMPRFQFSGTSANPDLTLRTVIADDYGSVTSDAEILEQVYIWQELSLAGELDQGVWQFNADARLAERTVRDTTAAIDGSISIELGIDENGMLTGGSNIRFQDLGWLAAFVPELSAVMGNLQSEIDFGGSLSQPNLGGTVQLNDGSFLIDRAGVTFTEVEFMLQSTAADSATFAGRLASGDGYLAFEGGMSALNTPDWEITADLQGEEMELVNLPDLQLRVSPTLNMLANSSQLGLNGDLLISTLDLFLRELPESAVDISRDVVIVRFPENRPELGRSFAAGQTSVMNLPLVLDIELILGENVRFSGFGLQAELDGNLSIQQTPTGRNLTYGGLAITEGSYEIYGQTLSLQDGELLFLGNYNNPAVDIRAVREVDELTVGVVMNGTLQNLRSELFSMPVLPEGDIISVLVTGRRVADLQSGEGASVLGAITTLGLRQSESLSQQIGDTLGLDTVAVTNTGDVDSSMLTVGKYLTPELFIRYGVGLFDNVSKVAVDYSISERLMLQAESGEYQSLDLTYKVER